MDYSAKRICIAVGMLTAAVSMFAGTAQADIGNGECGRLLRTDMKSESAPTTVTSTQFITIARLAVDAGGVGGNCAVLLFTAQTTCKGPTKTNRCYVRVIANGQQMTPGPQVLDSESETPATHAFQWVRRGLLATENNFRVEVRVDDSTTTLELGGWTAKVDMLANKDDP